MECIWSAVKALAYYVHAPPQGKMHACNKCVQISSVQIIPSCSAWQYRADTIWRFNCLLLDDFDATTIEQIARLARDARNATFKWCFHVVIWVVSAYAGFLVLVLWLAWCEMHFQMFNELAELSGHQVKWNYNIIFCFSKIFKYRLSSVWFNVDFLEICKYNISFFIIRCISRSSFLIMNFLCIKKCF